MSSAELWWCPREAGLTTESNEPPFCTCSRCSKLIQSSITPEPFSIPFHYPHLEFKTVFILLVAKGITYLCCNLKFIWGLKNWCFWTVVLEKTLENPLYSKEIKPVNPKWNQPWIFIGKDCCWSWSFSTLATWCKQLIHWKRSWWQERLKAKGEKGGRG